MNVSFLVDARHHGHGPVLAAWAENVATSGSSRVVHIFSRSGTLLEQVVPRYAGAVSCLEWDPSGDVLAVAQRGSSNVLLFSISTRRLDSIDAGGKDVTFLRFDQTGEHLAVGTARGAVNVVHLPSRERRTVPSKQKHRVLCGDWSRDGVLAYATEDRQVTFCNAYGELLDRVKVKLRPASLRHGARRRGAEPVVSLNMDGATLLLYSLADKDGALELAFQERYGRIVSHRWFGDGFLIVCFSSGYVVVVSTAYSEIGREQYCARVTQGELVDACYCPQTFTVAACCTDSVQLVNLRTWTEVGSYVLDRDAGAAARCEWVGDCGTTLSVSTTDGCLYVFRVRPGGGGGGEESGTEGAHLSALLRPLPLARFLALVLIVAAAGAAGAARALDVSHLELLRALHGGGEAF